MQTRSKTAAQLRFERRYQIAVEKYTQTPLDAFNAAIGAILRQWTALELAVVYQWGGPESGDFVQSLQDELFELFLGPDKVYRDDVSLVLEDYLETQFNTICEDGSPDEIGQLLCLLWGECLSGDFSRVNMLVAREAERRREDIVKSSQGLSGTGDADDDEDNDGHPDPEGLIAEAMEGMEGAAAQSGLAMIAEDEEEEEAPPLVDEDGFQTVTRKGKKGAKSSKRKPT